LQALAITTTVFFLYLAMSLFEAFILGIIQGITEFLPISSSGHLAFFRALFNNDLEAGITFEIVVHFGSFCSIVLYYRKRLGGILVDFFKSLSPSALKQQRFKTDPNTQLSLFIILSMIPAMLVGFTLKDTIESLFDSPVFVSAMLLITGLILYSTKLVSQHTKEMSAGRGFLMGIAQALAIIPGISRAGSTISTGLLLGVKRDTAANFSFLMVLPVLAGAMILAFKDLFEMGVENIQVAVLLIGFFSSFVVGYACLAYLMKLLKRDKFHYFAFYCWIVGTIGIIYFW